jgi:hypothetical protein
MDLFFPDNIYSRLYADSLPGNLKEKVTYVPSSSIPGELKKNNNSAGLITPTDILSSTDLFISSKIGISFEGNLSNSYFYFDPGQKDLTSLSLIGDISSLEVILSKIFFKESYNSEIQIEILTDIQKAGGKNLLVTGDINLHTLRFHEGLSFAEEMVDLLSLPFVNFILASSVEKIISDMNNACSGISQKIYDSVENNNFGGELPPSAKDYIKDNIASLIYEFEAQDIDDIHQLIRLPYFYGIIQDIIEPKFI